MHKKLKEAGIPVPEYAVLNRNENGTTGKCVCNMFIFTFTHDQPVIKNTYRD